VIKLFDLFKRKSKEEVMPQFVVMNCVKNCGKDKCPVWVVNYSPGPEGKQIADGRCGIAWLPVLLIEIRQAIDRFNPNLKEANHGEDEKK
jgi:hypothetical protein